MSKDPAARIRTTSVLALVAVGLLARDLMRIYRWSGQASAIARDHARQSARELNDLEDRLQAEHRARVQALEGQVNKLLDELQGRTPRADPGPA